MKTKINSYIRKIQAAVNELQTYSYSEFQKILPAFIKENKELNYSLLQKYFEGETGVSLKDYFHHVKALKASELLYHYKLGLVEVAYQLGFKTPSSLNKAMGFRKQYYITRIQYPGLHRRSMTQPKYV